MSVEKKYLKVSVRTGMIFWLWKNRKRSYTMSEWIFMSLKHVFKRFYESQIVLNNFGSALKIVN